MSEQAERAILHSVLIDESLLSVVSLRPVEFSVSQNAQLFSLMLGLHKENKPIEANLLSDDPRMLAYIASLEGGSRRPGSVEAYCQVVRETHRKQKLQFILDAALNSEGSSLEIARKVESQITELTQTYNFRREVLLPAAKFCATMPEEIPWAITGIIPKGSNGIISGEPKASKSWIADETSLSVASGESFLGLESFSVPRPLKTALIAREDYPGLTSWRLSALFRSRKWKNPNFFAENLWINTRAQSETFSVDNSEEIEEIIAAFKRRQIEFAIFDVLNILHGSDENDNTEMRQVMNKFSHIQSKTGAQIGLVHHLGKADGKWTRRLRGASSIHGWVEWLIGVTEVDEESRIRKMEFELKAGEAPKPVFYRIESEHGSNLAQIRVCDGPSNTNKWT